MRCALSKICWLFKCLQSASRIFFFIEVYWRRLHAHYWLPVDVQGRVFRITRLVLQKVVNLGNWEKNTVCDLWVWVGHVHKISRRWQVHCTKDWNDLQICKHNPNVLHRAESDQVHSKWPPHYYFQINLKRVNRRLQGLHLLSVIELPRNTRQQRVVKCLIRNYAVIPYFSAIEG